jgi:hypothetical protein
MTGNLATSSDDVMDPVHRLEIEQRAHLRSIAGRDWRDFAVGAVHDVIGPLAHVYGRHGLGSRGNRLRGCGTGLRLLGCRGRRRLLRLRIVRGRLRWLRRRWRRRSRRVWIYWSSGHILVLPTQMASKIQVLYPLGVSLTDGLTVLAGTDI